MIRDCPAPQPMPRFQVGQSSQSREMVDKGKRPMVQGRVFALDQKIADASADVIKDAFHR